jgi:hypothetical protein
LQKELDNGISNCIEQRPQPVHEDRPDYSTSGCCTTRRRARAVARRAAARSYV